MKTSTDSISCAFALLALAVCLGGCDKKADQASCEKMVEHDYEIIDKGVNMGDTPAGKKILDQLKASTLKGCVETMTMSQVECHMKSTTTADMTKCDAK